MVALIIVLAIVLLLVFWAVGAYKRLAGLRNLFKHAFSQIDVQFKRRYDLVPNLVETAKGYMKHERETLEAVIAARNQAVSANACAASDPTDSAAMQQMASSEGALASSLGKMFVLSEAYPDLKANQNMLQLTEELTSTENRIAFARQAYNDGVMQYNTALAQFPGSLLADVLGFKLAETLPTNETLEERRPVKAGF